RTYVLRSKDEAATWTTLGFLPGLRGLAYGCRCDAKRGSRVQRLWRELSDVPAEAGWRTVQPQRDDTSDRDQHRLDRRGPTRARKEPSFTTERRRSLRRL